MPMEATDGRALTWRKWVDFVTAKVVNEPTSTNDCCFVGDGFAGDTSGYPMKKLATRGSGNKWGVHRIMFFMMHPDQLALARDLAWHCAHGCSRGRCNFTQSAAYFN